MDAAPNNWEHPNLLSYIDEAINPGSSSMVFRNARGEIMVCPFVTIALSGECTIGLKFHGPSASFRGPLNCTTDKRHVQWAGEVLVLVVETAEGNIAIPTNVDRERGGVVSVKRVVGAEGTVQTVDMTLKEAAAAIMEASARNARQ